MKILKVLGALVAVVVVIVGGVFAWAYTTTQSRLAKKYEVAVQDITIPTESAQVERGKHLAMSLAGCGQCHGADLGGASRPKFPVCSRPTRPTSRRGKAA